uniref:Uncharacterized protein n=1 Tax=Noctiluca scintillans TaxID=2966 RepID=A0A7S1EYM7_NOCSC|mmetsp:Transcript_18/g.32  ORF Transcript_18/g.32 Transcript_18/m.32 type:complete len:250 (+) Transcript_18:84-833(+)
MGLPGHLSALLRHRVGVSSAVSDPSGNSKSSSPVANGQEDVTIEPGESRGRTKRRKAHRQKQQDRKAADSAASKAAWQAKREAIWKQAEENAAQIAAKAAAVLAVSTPSPVVVEVEVGSRAKRKSRKIEKAKGQQSKRKDSGSADTAAEQDAELIHMLEGSLGIGGDAEHKRKKLESIFSDLGFEDLDGTGVGEELPSSDEEGSQGNRPTKKTLDGMSFSSLLDEMMPTPRRRASKSPASASPKKRVRK